jgi:nucleotide-binding universal stress UspA family protein
VHPAEYYFGTKILKNGRKLKMYKTILVPLDGSKRAERILPHVEELANRYRAKVIFVSAREFIFAAGVEGSFIEFNKKDFDAQTKEAESYLKKISEKFRRKDIKTKTVVVNGPAVERIIQIADKENADLIAMTSHGEGGIGRVFYGSVAAGVLNRIDRPLLVIRSRKE